MPKIPNAILNELKCKHCRCWLSCGPVYVLPQGSSLCGRCEAIAIKQYRHAAFEALAAYFQYPCQYYYRHCPEALQWNESLDHEEDCGYQNCCSRLCIHPTSLFKSDRKLDLNEEIRCIYIPDALLVQLKCRACDRYLSSSPVYVRTDGSSLCHRCTTSNGPPADAIRHVAFEKLVNILIFPCVYRTKGCTQYFRFGHDMLKHEMDCSYGITYRPGSRRVQKGPKDKERGVIETATGHIYGTITPNALQLFAPPQTHMKKAVINGQVELTKESSVNQNDEFIYALKKQQQKFSSSRAGINGIEYDKQNSKASERSQEVPPTPKSSIVEIPRIDPQRLYNVNNVSRNNSFYSGNNRESEEAKYKPKNQNSSNRTSIDADSQSSKSKDISVNIPTNLDDIFWVYDEVVNEIRSKNNSSGNNRKNGT